MDKYIEITTTTADKKDADNISREILNNKLAACVQIEGPIKSIYWWKDNLEESEEWLCRIKTKKALFNQIESVIKKMHPYELPEIIAKEILAGSKEYLEWMDNVVK